MSLEKVLLDGQWRQAESHDQFQAFNPTTGEKINARFPISSWADCEVALKAATQAFESLQRLKREDIAQFLESFASAIETNSDVLVEMAHLETGLAKTPRLADVELPRTTNQLRQAAAAVRDASWARPTIDSVNNIRSMLQGIGPVIVFGPNNFPFAFGSVSGGDFAAAIAAGNPVIAKAHPLHPGTTRLLAELANQAVKETGLPQATVQMIYALSDQDGLDLVSDPRTGATGFTGSRTAGLALKRAADQVGNPIYLEMSSLNPVIVLQKALAEKADSIAQDFAASCTLAAGQLCTKPGLLLIPQGVSGDRFVAQLKDLFLSAPTATLLSPSAATMLGKISDELVAAGATLHTPKQTEETGRFCQPNTLLSISGENFMNNQDVFTQEMFGNASLVVLTESVEQIVVILKKMEGNLTGCIYSHTQGDDDADYDLIEPLLREKVGRVLNDKMPTGVAVSGAMNHGGPFPASGHPGFTAVGMPAAIQRFTVLKCFDGIRQHRLPDLLGDRNPSRTIWRLMDGHWSTAHVREESGFG